MPPDERRAAIIAAVLPLLEEHGPDVSTRRLAEAAGVAEGTIFRAFGTKDALIEAAMRTAFDAAPLLAMLREIDQDLPLRERMIAGVEISQRRLRAVFKLMFSLRLQRPPQFKGVDPEDAARRKADAEESDRIFADLLRPDADRLRFTPEEIVHRLRLLTFSATHPLISDGRPMTAEEIVDFTLDGVRHHEPGDH